MCKFQKVGLAMLFAAGMVFAKGSIWSVGAPYGIAQFYWIRECLEDTGRFDETDENNECYKDLGGWWFGFVAGPSSGDVNPPCDIKRNDGHKSDYPDGNYVRANINGDWVSFVGNDNDNCEGPPFTDKEDGGKYLIDYSLDMILNIGPGIDAGYKQAMASIGLNFSQPPDWGYAPPVDRDFSDKDGFCMAYELTGDVGKTAENFVLELGWNDDDAAQEPETAKTPYDAWYHPIPDAAGVQEGGVRVKDFLWTGGKTGTGGFKQEGWATPEPWPLSKAITQMRSVKIVLKARKTPYNAIGPITFKLRQFGWAGECDETACDRNESCGTPITAKPVLANASFKQVGRTFSMLSYVNTPVAVQVINLQGAVVHSQTMSTNGTMNLSNLPTGIYMLRVPALGYTNKFVLR